MSGSESDVHRELGSVLIRLARAYRRHLDRQLADLSLSHAGGLAVMLLGRTEQDVRQGVLAEMLGVEGPSIVPIVDQMERAGLLERCPDPTDGRAKILHLTQAGRDLAKRAEQRARSVRADLFAGISEEDCQVTLSTLQRLQAALAGSPETD